MGYTADRQERKLLKQKLFTIRRYVEGERVKLTPEMRELKKKYEGTPGFTSWSDFPHAWDIGDPKFVKKGSPAFNEADYRNQQKIGGKSYDTIVALDLPPKTKQEIEALTLLKQAELEKKRLEEEKEEQRELLKNATEQN